MKQKISSVRLIGGKWRGKRISFPDLPTIRPTPDRIRETLFNWLGADIYQSHCLDLFAGSGALGFEALSRGASQVTFVDNDQQVIRHLTQQALALGGRQYCDFIKQNACVKFIPPMANYNVVFMDPPYYQHMLEGCCQLLADGGYLNNGAFIYIEAEAQLEFLPVPASWVCCHQKHTKTIGYYLYQFQY